MNDSTTYKTAPHKGGTKDCCTGVKCESGLRNNYFEGKRLTADSFQVEQDYMLGRRRLLNRAMFGWGVVYGYEVTPVITNDPKRKVACGLKIGPGLALDKCGRELLQEETIIGIDDLIIDETDKLAPDKEDVRYENLGGSKRALRIKEILERLRHHFNQLDEHPTDNEKTIWWELRVHYAERGTGHVKIEDRCRCEHDEWDHTCETVRYSLQPVDNCCTNFDCELTCECGSGDCCGEPKLATADVLEGHGGTRERIAADKTHKRGGCRCLCDYVTKLPLEGKCAALCEIDEQCGGSILVDLKNGVPLACVELIKDADCDRWTFGKVEACGPRRLVKRNDLLFDLIRGCDLTTIKKISWPHRPADAIDYKTFSHLFGTEGQLQKACVTNFSVEFSRKVRRDTVRSDCFAMTIIVYEGDDRWWEASRVPIVGVDFTGYETDDHNLVRGAKLVVSRKWLDGGVRGTSSRLEYKVARVEIEVRGDFIVDCNGQTVDANASGLSSPPHGNGSPGGTFLSTFRVNPAPKEPEPDELDDEDDDSKEGVL